MSFICHYSQCHLKTFSCSKAKWEKMIKYEILRFVFKVKHQKFRNGKGCAGCNVLAPTSPSLWTSLGQWCKHAGSGRLPVASHGALTGRPFITNFTSPLDKETAEVPCSIDIKPIRKTNFNALCHTYSCIIFGPENWSEKWMDSILSA